MMRDFEFIPDEAPSYGWDNDLYIQIPNFRWIDNSVWERNPRECSNCGEEGHTKRTCSSRKALRKKVFLYISVPDKLAREFPDRKYPPHVTLLHIGDLTKKQWKRLLPVIDSFMEDVGPFRVDMSNFNVFKPQYTDDAYPHMMIDSMGLTSLHHELKEYLREHDFTVRHYGQFTPHATLDKIDVDDRYEGPKPTGSWVATEVNLFGFDEFIYELGESHEVRGDKQVIIMRGIPGAGKSTYLEENYPEAEVVSADDFFTKRGIYNFDSKKAWLSHKLCYDKYIALLDASIESVAVDNTNITKSEVRRYRDAAIERGYKVKLITILEDPDEAFNVGIHNVAKKKIYEMHRKLERTEIPEEWDHDIIDYT